MDRPNVSNLVIVLLWLMSGIAILIRVYSLRFNPPEDPVLFWLPYIVFVSASAWVVLTKEGRIPLCATLCMSFVLNLILKVRWPGGFLWGVDPPHHAQIASRIIGTGHLAFGYSGFTGEAFSYSFYPSLDLLLSSINMLTAIPLEIVYTYTFTFVNMTTLLFLYWIMKGFFGKGSKIVDLCIFLYALCPKLHGFNNAAVSESLAIVFYPLLISIFVFNSNKSVFTRKTWVILLTFAVFITITHHWTMYMLLFHATTIVLGMYIFRRKMSRAHIRMLLLLTILWSAWLFFILHRSSLVWTQTAIRALLSGMSSEQQVTVPKAYSLPSLERTLSYAGVGLLLLTSFLGVCQVGWSRLKGRARRIKSLPLILWWAVDAGLIILFELIPWRSIGLVEAVDIRFRHLEFTYFGIVAVSAIGILFLLGRLTKRLKLAYLSQVVGVLLLLLIAVPTVTLGFPYYVYDNPPLKSSDADIAYPEQSYVSSMWLRSHIESGWVAGTWNLYAYISGHAQLNFSYPVLVESIEQRKILMEFYSINKASILLPDDFNFKLELGDVAWLDDNFNRVYDNGALITYSHAQ